MRLLLFAPAVVEAQVRYTEKCWQNLFRCGIHTLANKEGGAAFGAAILAGVGAGIYPSVREACDKFIQEQDTMDFDPAEADLYEKYHAVYDQICMTH